MAVFPYVFPLQIGNALNVLFHSVSAGLFHLLCDMPIHVQRKGSGVVAQIALDSLDIIPSPEGSNCKAVSEIVQTCVRHTDRGHNLLVVVVKGAGGKVVAPCVREYIPAVMPEGTSFQPVPGLLGLVLLQQLYHESGGGDGAALVVFGGSKDIFSRVARDVLELLVMRMVPRSKSTASQVRPQASALRIPVKSMVK